MHDGIDYGDDCSASTPSSLVPLYKESLKTLYEDEPDAEKILKRKPLKCAEEMEKTEEIHQALVKAAKTGDPATRFVISKLAEKDRVSIPGLPKGD